MLHYRTFHSTGIESHQKALEKKQTRRAQETIELMDYDIQLHKAVAPKKPEEFKLTKMMSRVLNIL